MEEDGAKLVPLYAFGVQGNIRDNVHHVDEERVLYPVGAHVVIYNLDNKEMSFLPEYDKVKSIQALAVTPNKKYLAVSERLVSEVVGQVSIINIQTRKRVRTFSSPDIKEYTALAFSGDNRYLIMQGGAPDYQLLYWNIDKSKIVATTKVTFPVSRISFNPWDNSQLATSGQNILKVWRLVEGQLKGFNVVSKREIQNYIDHCWLQGDILVVATDSGEVLICVHGEVKNTYPNVLPHGAVVTVVEAYTKGFLAAGPGYLAFMEKVGEREFQCVKTFVTGNDDPVFALSVSPSDDSIFCSFTNNQLAVFPLANVDILKEDNPNNFSFLGGGFHSGSITGLDVCVRKPFVATCGADRTIRVWNYLERSCEIVKQFDEEPLSVSFHPAGFQLVAGFGDRLRMFTLVVGELKLDWELTVKGCREVRFSNGGQYFAAISNTNILVYSTYSFENIAVFKGHIGAIRSISWTQDDHGLVSAGLDGAVYEWRMEGSRRVADNVIKTCQYTCSLYRRDGKAVIACGSDRNVREITNGNLTTEIPTGPNRVTQMALNKTDRALFAGTVGGTLRAFDYPFSSSSSDIREWVVHAGSVTRLRMSFDDTYLFSTSEDGCMFVMEVVYVDNSVPQPRKSLETAFSELVLVTRQEMEERRVAMAELESKISEMKTETEYQLHLKEQHFAERLKKQQEEMEARLETQESRYQELKEKKEAQELEAAEVIHVLEDEHQRAARELEVEYEKKVNAEIARYDELAKEKDDMQCQLEEQLHKREQELEQQMEDEISKREAEKAELQSNYDKLKEQWEDFKLENEEQFRQIEEEQETELDDTRDKARRDLQVERDNSMSLKGEAAILRKKFEIFQQEQETLRQELTERDAEIRLLQKTCNDLERTITMLKKELRERNDTIGQKEKRIFDLKQKNQELEKFRFVLDYKIGELRKEIEPRDEQISDMREQIKEMDDELQRAHRNADNLDQVISDRNLKIDALHGELSKVRREISEKERLIKLFVEDLHKLYTETEPVLWREGVKQLYNTYVTRASKKRISKEEKERMQEFARQREYMERSLHTLKKKAVRTEDRLKVDFHRKLSENAALVNELNALRREHHELNAKYNAVVSQLQALESDRLREQSRAATRASTHPSTTMQSPSPQPKGKVKKGSTVGWGELSRTERARMAEMILQLEENNSEMQVQRTEIRRLREQVQHLLNRSILDGTDDLPQRPASSEPLGSGKDIADMIFQDTSSSSQPRGGSGRRQPPLHRPATVAGAAGGARPKPSPPSSAK